MKKRALFLALFALGPIKRACSQEQNHHHHAIVTDDGIKFKGGEVEIDFVVEKTLPISFKIFGKECETFALTQVPLGLSFGERIGEGITVSVPWATVVIGAEHRFHSKALGEGAFSIGIGPETYFDEGNFVTYTRTQAGLSFQKRNMLLALMAGYGKEPIAAALAAYQFKQARNTFVHHLSLGAYASTSLEAGGPVVGYVAKRVSIFGGAFCSLDDAHEWMPGIVLRTNLN